MPHVLAPRLRRADVEELAANGREPLPALLRCLSLSAVAHAVVDAKGDPQALYGFAPIGNETGCPWLLGSDALVTTHRGWFLRNSQTIMGGGDRMFRRVWNRVDSRNAVHVRWLRWVGCTLEPAAPFGPLGLPFHVFHREAR